MTTAFLCFPWTNCSSLNKTTTYKHVCCVVASEKQHARNNLDANNAIIARDCNQIIVKNEVISFHVTLGACEVNQKVDNTCIEEFDKTCICRSTLIDSIDAVLRILEHTDRHKLIRCNTQHNYMIELA